ncbi:unnamed protein product, partial [marine sediment metagenome]
AEKVPKQPKKAKISWPPRRRLGLSVVLEKIIFGRGISSKFNPIRAIIVLLFIMVVLAGIKIGRNRTKTENLEGVSGSKEVESIESGGVEESLPHETREDLISAKKAEEDKTDEEEAIFGPIGNHVIVIMTYGENRDLEPVKEFFAESGIRTVIEKRGEYYFLLTKDHYQSPERENSDGYKALQKIKRIGASYQAPIGYETFGSMPFQDAYGMKIR